MESATYITASAAGLDTGGESIPYVAGWGEKGALDAIQQVAQLIDAIALRIEEAIALAGGSENEHDERGAAGDRAR